MRFDCPGCGYGCGGARLARAADDGVLVCPRCQDETPWREVVGKVKVGRTLPASDADDFDGETYDRPKDRARLGRQLTAVATLMEDGEWRTLAEIAKAIGAPEASVSARLRDLRKPKFGRQAVQSQRRGGSLAGLWEYRIEKKGG